MNRPIDLTTTFVYIIDESLKMSKGKIAAQVSHCAMLLADKYNCLGRAIILKMDHNKFGELLRDAEGILDEFVYIKDAGLTEVPPGTVTCIAFKQTVIFRRAITKDLKLV
jgi:peptidyl-tRNA hydrolase, PTH2 family